MPMNWDDIDGYVSRKLSFHPGWRDQLIIELGKVHRAFTHGHYSTDDGEVLELPEIFVIKQKHGLLNIYTKGGSDVIIHDILNRANRISETCEHCGNSAKQQRIGNWISTLCCWCYNAEIERKYKDSDVSWPNMLELDVAERFPEVVGADCATLTPNVGKGWYVIIGRFLEDLVCDPDFKALPPGTISIAGFRSDRVGKIALGVLLYHDVIERHAEQLEFASTVTCARCGHEGGIARRADKSDMLCGYCAAKPGRSKRG